ncbi:hypothetical protein [Curtobacterium sp. MCBA15_013]|uniref:hypothetical protein n=1 Tax=Curtobacterium sp. MCBA15_013 TaxID=1898739 RepID=UPI0011139A13|nr:hypothetical protein [Curtobacterium sp. MCBA15_013]
MNELGNARLWKSRLSSMWTDDDGSGLQLIDTSLLALPAASVADDSEAMSTLERWIRGGSPQPTLQAVPLINVDASLQGVVRLDVILHYLEAPNTLWDSVPSSWGAGGPLAVRLRDGRLVLVDGNHRWVAALLTDREYLLMQILPAAAR